MEPADPGIDLILSRADPPELCWVCERNHTSIQCDSCEPSHRICRDCIGPHRDDFNRVVGNGP